MTKTTVLILAACGRRFDGKLRQFLRVGGKTLLERLLRQVEENGHEAIVVSHLPEIQKAAPMSFDPKNRNQGSDTLLSTEPLWGGRTVALVSDAAYSDEVVRFIFEDESPVSFFGKRHELFAVAFDAAQAGRVKEALRRCYDETPEHHVAWKWRFYRTLCGTSVLSWKKDGEIYKPIPKDFTADFDHLHEYRRFLQNNPWANEGKRNVYISGCWDLLHAGHLSVLKRARALGDFLVVGVNTDEMIRSYKGEPSAPFSDRLLAVEALDFVDAVVLHRSFTDLTGVIGYGVSVRAVGPEWGRFEGQQEARRKHDRDGVKIVELPRTPGICTTIIKERTEK